MDNTSLSADIVVVGAGNAALCAAIAAAEKGGDVLVLEAASCDERGGNSRFTAGAMRIVYNGVADLRQIITDLSDADVKKTDFGKYSSDDYFDDMVRTTQCRSDPELIELLVKNSFETVKWMKNQGVRFQPSYGRQAFNVDGQFKFWGGLAIETWGGGAGLVESLFQRAEELGVRIVYEARATELKVNNGRVVGVLVNFKGGAVIDVNASSVVLASGGFEANAEMRARYLGPDWDLAKVRGTRHNMGEGIAMALAIGASPSGNWSGCHAVGWDMNAPEFGDLAVGDGFQKHSYPFGIMVNAHGKRFLDEGADFRNFTYAKYGREILAQPGNFAWQVFDAKVSHLLRDEYRIREVTRAEAGNISELADKLEGVNKGAFLKTVTEFNNAIMDEKSFNPNVKDGRATKGLTITKSNWANPLDTPPFEAYCVTCGVTFTFGGLRIDNRARVLDVSNRAIPGLYAAGELVGGLFYFNYPGGTGLTSGAVFGRIAGTESATHVLK